MTLLGVNGSTLAINEAERSAIDSLVEQMRGGDRDAFEHLISRFQQRVHRWALSYTADADEADDVVQETFVLVLRHIGNYRGDGAFAVWLYQIARRAAMKMKRKNQRRRALNAGPRAAPDSEFYETDPGGRVDREHLGAALRQYWLELPERQRVVLDLVDMQGLTPAEAGEMLGLNPSTLRANLFKARRAVRLRLLARYPDLAQAYADKSAQL